MVLAEQTLQQLEDAKTNFLTKRLDAADLTAQEILDYQVTIDLLGRARRIRDRALAEVAAAVAAPARIEERTAW